MSSPLNESKVLVVGDENSLALFRMAGMSVKVVSSQAEAEAAVSEAPAKGFSLVIVLRHVVSDEDSIRKIAKSAGVTLLLLPTKWSRGEPINVEKLLLQALGLG